MRAVKPVPAMGKLWLIAPPPLLSSSPTNRSSTPLEILFRSSRIESCSLLFPVILVERLCACVSSGVVSALVSDASTVDRLVCVDIEDCSNVFESSSACTLRARSESR